MTIYLVSEIEGPSILCAKYDREDARSFLHWGEADGSIPLGHYTVTEVVVS